jgi:thioesterase domain-containing protein
LSVIRTLRKQLKNLPYYSVPSSFVTLRRLPLTQNGKTDYAALPRATPSADLRDCEGVPSALTPLQETLGDLWQEVLGVSEAGLDDDFFELGGDSFRMVTLQALVERRLKKTLCLSDCVKARTIRKMADLLADGKDSGLPFSPLVVALRETKHNAKAPLFLVAGHTDVSLECYLHLASELPEDQAIYGLQSPVVMEGTDLKTIESIAAQHLRALRDAQSSGPYYLAGFCFGGLVAFEMAQQLTAQSEDVRFLGIIDYAMNSLDVLKFRWAPSDLWKWTKNFAYAMTDLWEAPSDETKSCVQRWVARSRHYWGERFHFRYSSAAGNLDQTTVFTRVGPSPDEAALRTEIEYKAWQDYRPHSYAGRVTLFRPRRLPVFQPYDETLGWSGVATGPLDVIHVPGPAFHGYMMTAAIAPALAKLVGRSLAIAQTTARVQSTEMAQT